MGNKTALLEIQLPVNNRLALEALGDDLGLSASVLACLGIDWVLARRALQPAGPCGFVVDLYEAIAALSGFTKEE